MPKQIRRRRDANPEDGLEKYGKATFADPVNNKYPIDTPGRIKAAWADISAQQHGRWCWGEAEMSDEQGRGPAKRTRHD